VSARKRQVLIILGLMLVVVVVDQASKAWVRANVPLHAALAHGPDDTFFRLTYAQNRGLVNSAFQDVRWVVVLAPLVATCFLFYLFRYLDPRSWIQTPAFGLVLGGAVGNIIDRLYYGFVTDFIQIHFHFIPFNFPWKYWPPFNVADSAICVGVAVLAVTLLGAAPADAPALDKPKRA
jgi:signal peptidase II